MKPLRECCMSFWSRIIYSDILNRSDISQAHNLLTKLDPITEFWLYSNIDGGFANISMDVTLLKRQTLN